MSQYSALQLDGNEPPILQENSDDFRAPFDGMPDWAGVVTDPAMADIHRREMPSREALEIGSPYRSDRQPRNFRMFSFIISDTELAAAAAGATIREVPSDWPVWAVHIRQVRDILTGNTPANTLSVSEWGIDEVNEFLNIPAGLSTIVVKKLGAPVAAVAGAAYMVICYDRWIPPATVAASSGGGVAVQTVEIEPATIGTHTDVAQNVASVVLLAANAARKGATIVNDSAAILYVILDAAPASLTDYTVPIAPITGGIGGYYEVPFNYTGEIRGIWAAAGAGAARITELT